MLLGQFTYTASEAPGAYEARSGWKVQSVASPPGAPAPDEELVRGAARNVGGFRPAVVPELSTRADIEALPRCLRLDVVGPDVVCLSHLAPAGPDYSGRPNFFAHSLLVGPDGEDMDDLGHLRPADLWDAPLWLRPVGAGAVADSRLDGRMAELARGPELAPPPDGHRHLVVSAVHRALQTGTGAVFVVGDDPSEAARWAGLVGRLLLPAVAWQVPFSTYERIPDASSVAGLPFRLMGVPTSDADRLRRLPGDRYLVLEERSAPPAVGPGTWQLPNGELLRSSPWADLAESLARDGALTEVLEALGDLALEVGDSTHDRPEWALAAATLLTGTSAELRTAAAELAVQHWPAGLTAGPATVGRLVAGLDAGLGGRDAVLARLLPVAGGAVVQVLVTDSLAASESGAAPLGAEATYRLIAGLRSGDDALGRRAASAVAMRLVTDARSVRDWPVPPPWLQPYVLDQLAAELASSTELPGQKLTADAWAWLGRQDPVEGELTTAALEGLGPLDLERAARDVQLAEPRSRRPSPLARGAAFLAFMASTEAQGERPLETYCLLARDEAWPRSVAPMRLSDAVALVPVVQQPMAALVAELLRGARPSEATRRAAQLVLDHDGDGELGPSARDRATLEHHLAGEEDTLSRPSPVVDSASVPPRPPVRPSPGPRVVAAPGPLFDPLDGEPAERDPVEPDPVQLRGDLLGSLRTGPAGPVRYTRAPTIDEWDDVWPETLRLASDSPAGKNHSLIARLLVRGAICDWASDGSDPAGDWLTRHGDPDGRTRYVRCGLEIARSGAGVDGMSIKDAVDGEVTAQLNQPGSPPGTWTDLAREAAREVAQSVWARMRAAAEPLGASTDPVSRRSRLWPRGGSPQG